MNNDMINLDEYIESLKRFDDAVLEAYIKYRNERTVRNNPQPYSYRLNSFDMENKAYRDHDEGVTVAKIILDHFSGNVSNRSILEIGANSLRGTDTFPAIMIGKDARYKGLDPMNYVSLTDSYLVDKAGYGIVRGTAESMVEVLNPEKFDAIASISVLGHPTFEHSAGRSMHIHEEVFRRIVANSYFLTKEGGINIHFLLDPEGNHYNGLCRKLFEEIGFRVPLCEIKQRGLIIVTK